MSIALNGDGIISGVTTLTTTPLDVVTLDATEINVGTGASVFSPAANTLAFGTNGAEKLRVLAAGGLTFNGDTAAANALDDYEEGNWTPTYIVASGTITAHSNTSGRYVKIGKNVYIWGYISYQSNSGASGNVRIGGLPFTSGSGFGQSGNNSGGVFSTGNFSFPTNTPQYGKIESVSTSIVPLSPRSVIDVGFLQLTFADFDARPNYSQFIFAGQYLTD